MNKVKNQDNMSLDTYIQSLYHSSNKKCVYSEFYTKSISLLSSLPNGFVFLDSQTKYATLVEFVKLNKIDIKDLHYIVDNPTFFEGFRHHMISSFESDFDILKNRPKAKKSPITFDALDEKLMTALNGQSHSV